MRASGYLGLALGASPAIGPMVNTATGLIDGYQSWFQANGSDDLYYFNSTTKAEGSTGLVVNPYSIFVSYTQGVRLV